MQVSSVISNVNSSHHVLPFTCSYLETFPKYFVSFRFCANNLTDGSAQWTEDWGRTRHWVKFSGKPENPVRYMCSLPVPHRPQRLLLSSMRDPACLQEEWKRKEPLKNTPTVPQGMLTRNLYLFLVIGNRKKSFQKHSQLPNLCSHCCYR